MRYSVYFSLLLCMFLFSCRKGKKLPETVYVHYDGAALCSVYPGDNKHHLPIYDPWNPYTPSGEDIIYAEYTDTDDAAGLAGDFNDALKNFLKKNNVILTTDPAEYTLNINYLTVSESIHSESYTDTCSNTPGKVYYFSLDAGVKATLYKNGGLIESWERTAMSTGGTRTKTDKCGRPKVRGPLRQVNWLVDQLAKELRVKVSKKLYDIEVE